MHHVFAFFGFQTVEATAMRLNGYDVCLMPMLMIAIRPLYFSP